MNTHSSIRLNPKADFRLRNGHLWIYSNEINTDHYALKNLQPGDLAIVENAAGKPMGLAYFNPNTLICGRILDVNINVNINAEFFSKRIQVALALREQLFSDHCYRLIYG